MFAAVVPGIQTVQSGLLVQVKYREDSQDMVIEMEMQLWRCRSVEL